MFSGPWGSLLDCLFFDQNTVNFLCSSAKLAIWLTHKTWTQGAGSVDLVLVLKGPLKASF